MRLVSVPFCAASVELRNGLVSACPITFATDKPLMRCAPHSAEISVAWDAPNFLRVVLEEGAVQAVSETVDEKIFQGDFGRSGLELRLAVAQPDFECFEEPQIPERACVQSQRVVEEPPSIENSG